MGQKANRLDVSGLPDGFTIEASASGSQTDAGTSANKVNDGWVIRDASGADVTKRFAVSKKVDGTLTVNRAPATATTGSAAKAYDGKALTSSEAEIKGLVNGETAQIAATGSQTEIGSSSNTCTIKWGSAKPANYDVTETLGTLTVTDSDAELVLTASSASKTYDGEELTSPEVIATGLPDGFTAEATASGAITDAGSVDNVVNEGFVIRNAAGEDKTANFKNIQTVNGTLTVNRRDLTITTGSASKAYDGSALKNAEATAEGFVEGETADVTATGSQTEKGSAANSYDIRWGSAKAANYKLVENLGTLTVTENNAAVILTAASANKVYDGKELKDAAVTASGLPEGFRVSATATGSQTNAGSSFNAVSDRYEILNAAGSDRTANFTNVTKVNGTLTVSKAELTVTTGSGSKEYDGAALTNEEAKLEGLVNEETATVKATGSQTETGTGDNGYSIEWGTAKADNYTIREELGTLSVTENNSEVTLTAASGSKTYDGTELTNSEVTAEGLPEGFTVVASATGSITDAGTVSNIVNDDYLIKNSTGEDRTACFANIKKAEGALTVEPKDATVTTGSASKEYDGTALRTPEASIDGLVSGETATVTTTGEITEVGTAENGYVITWGTAKPDNYKLSTTQGTLTVTENKSEVTLTAPSASKIYDGAELTEDGSGENKVVAGGLPEGFTVEATASGSITDAGEAANVVDDGFVIRDGEGNDRTAWFTNVKKVDGSLTVTPRALTITTGSSGRAYDGTPLINEEAAAEGLADGETLGLEATGSITETGSAENTCKITWAGSDNDFTAKESNYTVTQNLGTLTVTDSNVDVTLTAGSVSKTYDGKPLTSAAVTATGLPEGFTVEATASGSRTHAGSAANVVDDGFVIRNAAGEDRTANFKNVAKVDGTLTINPRPVTITTGSASKAYDGTELTSAEAVAEGIVAGETYGLAATGTITEVGSADNGYELTWATKSNDYTAHKMDYTVTDSLGTLTVTTNGNAVTLTASSGSKVYDGKALTNEEVTADGLPDGFTAEASAKGKQTDVGSSANKVKDRYVIRNAAGEDKTSNFTNVSTVDGLLTVQPRTVTVTTGSDSKEYDGTALKKDSAEISGLAEGDHAGVKATGEQVEVGSGPNTYEINWGILTKEENYTIEEKLGTLSVKENTSEVTLTAASATRAYDGRELSDESVTAEGLPEGFTVSATASGGQTEAGTSANVVNDGYVIRNADGADRTAYFTNVKKADGKLTVEKRNVTLTSATDEKTYDGVALVNNEVTIGGDGFADGEGAVFNVTGIQKDAGSSDNTFTYVLDAGTDAKNYNIKTEEGKLTVRPAEDKVRVTVTEHSGREKYDGQVKTVSGYDIDIDNELYPADSFTFSGNDTVSGTAAGVYPMEIKAEDFTNNSENFPEVEFVINDGTLEIAKRSVILTSASASANYNGLALINHLISVLGDGFASGEGASYSVTGSQKVVGVSDNEFTYTLNEGTNADNYDILATFGQLVVNNRPDDAKYEVTVTAASGSALYDGKEHSVSGFVGGSDSGIAVSVDGNNYTVSGLSASAAATDAGTYPVNITGKPKVTDEDGSDVTAQFMVNYKPGSLSIGKRSVTMTSGSASRVYNGKELTNDKVEVTGDGFAGGEGASYNVTGSRTLVGSCENAFTYQLNEGTDPANYNITANPGTLTVTSRDAKYEITVQAESGEFMYDGAEKTVEGFRTLTFTQEGSTYTVDGLSASVTAKDAGTYTSAVSGTPVVKDEAGNDVSDQFAVNTQPGSLVITRRNVTLTSASDSREYNGKALMNNGVTVSGNGFADGEGASYEVTGSRTLAGSSENSFTYRLNEGTNADNYNIETVPGTLTVTNRGAKYEITVQAASAEYLYDGTDKTAEGFDSLEFNVDGNSYTVGGLSAGVTAKDAGTYSSTVTGTPVVKDAAGNDVTAQFAVFTKPGSLVINKRSVTLTSASDERRYNGRALTNDKVEVTGDGFAEGEGASYSVTGSRTLVGMSENAFTYSLSGGTKADNYDIAVVFGQLTVTSREAKYSIELRPNSLSEMYDGTDKSVSGFETLSFLVDENRYTVTDVTAEATAKDAGEYPVNVTGTATVRDAEGNNVSDQFKVTSVPGTLSIGKRNVVMTSASSEKPYDGKALTNGDVAVTGDGFAEGEGAGYTVTGSQKIVGASRNSFTYKLNEGTLAGNYNITTEFGTLTVVNRADAARYEVTVTASSGSVMYDGKEHSVSGFVGDAEDGSIPVKAGGNSYTVSGLSASVSGTNAGTYTSAVTGTPRVTDEDGNDVTAQFIVMPVPGSLNIGKRSVTLTSGTSSREYNGKVLSNDEVTVSGDGFAEGEGASYDVSGKRTLAGSSENSFTYKLNDGTLADNYNITTVPGTLTVTNRDAKYEITVEALSGRYTYDGTDKTVSGFKTLEFIQDGSTYTVEGLSASASARDAGEYTAVVTGTPVVKDATGADVSDQFAVHTQSGSLVIDRRNVTLTSGSANRQYNGNALTNTEVTVGGDGFAEGEGAAYDVTGSRTLAGSNANTFTYRLNEGTNADNYNITTVPGTLTVTNRDAKYEITVKAASAGYMYDGSKKAVKGFETLEFTVDGNTYTVEGLSARASATDAGSYTSTVTGTPLVKDASGSDVTAQFAVNTQSGSLVIDKRKVTLTSASDSREYNGSALTKDEVTVSGDGFAEGEGASYSVTGSRTLVGVSDNTFSYTLSDGTKAGNYDIKTVPGSLTVTNRDAKYEITVQAESGEYMYDGTDKTAEGFSTLEFKVAGNNYTVEGLSAGVTAKDAGTYVSTVTGTPVVRDEGGSDVSSQFAVTTQPGSLVIKPRKITMTSGSATREYNGQPLTNAEVSVTGDGFAEGEGAAYSVTGTRTLVGMSENAFTYSLTGGAKASNYEISTVAGQLTVTSREAGYSIVLKANSLKEKYDGKDKNVSGFETLTFTAEGNRYTVTGVDAAASGKNAGTYPVNVTGTPKVSDAGGNDVTDQFIVTAEPGTLVIEPRTVILTSADSEKMYDGSALSDLTVNVSGDGFAEGEGATFSVTGIRKLAGMCENVFTYDLNEGTDAGNYSITVDYGTLTVSSRPEDARYEVTVTAASGSALYDGKAHSVSGFVGGAEDGSVTVTAGGHDYKVTGLNASASATDAGTYTAEVSGTPKVTDSDGDDVTDQFMVNVESGSLEIGKRNVTLTSGSATGEYTGKALANGEVAVGGDGFAEGEGASYNVTGSQKVVGVSENAFTYTLNAGTKAENYNIATELGKLVITNRAADAKYEVTVKAASASALYDGKEHSVSGFAGGSDDGIAVTAGGNSYTVSGLSASAAATNAGTYPVTISGTPKVTDEDGSDVTEQFIVDYEFGTLSIGKRSVTLTSASATQTYNGNALTSGDVAVTGDGFADGEGASYNVTGSRTLAGSCENSFTYTLNEGTDAANYDITKVPGTLTVTNRDAKYEITVQAESASYMYDGTEKTAEGFKTLTFTEEGNTYTVEGLSAKVTAKDAGTYTSAVIGTPVVRDANGSDVTDQFAVTTQAGSLVIGRRNITMTSGSANREYNGQALTNGEVTVSGDGFAEGEGAAYSVTGSRTLAGSSANAFTYRLNGGTNAANYNITTVPGTLTVTNRDAKYEITVQAASAGYMYDGTEKSAEGFTTLEFTADGNSYTVDGLSAGVTATDAGTYTSTVTGTPVVRDAAGNDVTAQFAVSTQPGSLVISPRKITMTSASVVREYNGRPLTKDVVTVTGDGFAEGEGAAYSVTGTRTLVGISDNAFTYSLTGGAKDTNYEITTVFGQLTITSRGAKYSIVLRPNSMKVKYDGNDKAVTGFEALSFRVDDNRYTVTDVEAGYTAKDAGTYRVGMTGTATVLDEDGNIVSDQFKVTSVPGELVIEPRNVILTSASSEKIYDGDPLTDDNVTVTGDGFAEGEGATYTVTGSQKVAGASANAFTYQLNEGTLAGNYKIEKKPGTLTVTNRSENAKYEVTVTAASDSVLYDGQEHSVSGFVGGAEDGSIAVSAGGHSYTVSGLSASAAATNAGEYSSAVTGTPRVTDEDGNDVTDQFVVRSAPGSLVIRKRSVTLTSASPTREYNGRGLTEDGVTVGGDGFAEGEGASFDVTGLRTLTGISENTFTYKLNEGTIADNYDIHMVYGQITVTSRDAKYGIVLRPKSLTEKYDGGTKSISGFESLSFTVEGNAYTVANVEAGCSAVNAGTYTVNVTGTPKVFDEPGNDVTDQFEITSEPGTLTIEPRTVVMTSADATKQYDGKELANVAVTVTGDGFAEGEGATYNVTGRRLLPGTEKNSFTYALNAGTLAGNYNISTMPGTLTVTNRDAKYEITVRAADATFMYDGTEKSVEGLKTQSFTIDGNSYTVEGMTAGAAATNAGEYASVVTGTPVVKDAAGNDVSGQFAVTTQPGRLVITPRKVIMTSGSATHAYNGKPLSNAEVTVTGDGFVEGEGATYDVTGTRTIVGVSDNLFGYELNDGTLPGNYDISKVYGKLNVTNRDAKYQLTLTPNGGSAMYDGEEHGVEGFVSTTAEVDGEKYEVSGLTAGAAGTDAGTYGVSVTGTAVITDSAGNDVTNQFSVVSNEATFTITPRSVLLRSADESREYDGTPLSGSGEFTVEGDGFVGEDGVTVTPTASRTLVGATENTFEWAFKEGTNPANYDVTVAYGLLSVTNRDALYELEMTANSDTVEYDGEEHSVNGFETNEFDVDGGKYTVDGVEADAKGTEAGVYSTDITGTAKVKDEEGNDVSDQFAVSYKSGSLTITKTADAGTGDAAGGGNTGGGSGSGGSGGTGGGSAGTGTGSGISTDGGSGTPGTVEIAPDRVPVTAAPAGYWALLNLIMMIINVLGGIYMLFVSIRRKEDDPNDPYKAAANEQEERGGVRIKLISAIAALLLAVISVVIFILTEDLSNSMTLFDNYTILMAILLIISVVTIMFGRRKAGNKDQNEGLNAQA